MSGWAERTGREQQTGDVQAAVSKEGSAAEQETASRRVAKFPVKETWRFAPPRAR